MNAFEQILSDISNFFKNIVDSIVNVSSVQCTNLIFIVAGGLFIYCLVRVLIKMFYEEQLVWAILGTIFFPVAYVWGWFNKDEHDLGSIMTLWTVAIGSLIGFYLLSLLAG